MQPSLGPTLLPGLILLVIGLQLLFFGLLAELVVRRTPDRMPVQLVRERLGPAEATPPPEKD